MPLIEIKTLWERHGRNGAIPATTTQQNNYEQVTCFLSSWRKRAATTMQYPTCAPHIVCDLQATILLKNHLQQLIEKVACPTFQFQKAFFKNQAIAIKNRFLQTLPQTE
jgi:hypothetical protein